MSLSDYLLLVAGAWYATTIIVEGYHGPLGIISRIKSILCRLNIFNELLNCPYCGGFWVSGIVSGLFYYANELQVNFYFAMHWAGIVTGMLVLYTFISLLDQATSFMSDNTLLNKRRIAAGILTNLSDNRAIGTEHNQVKPS